jgi:hypothetical protein
MSSVPSPAIVEGPDLDKSRIVKLMCLFFLRRSTPLLDFPGGSFYFSYNMTPFGEVNLSALR